MSEFHLRKEVVCLPGYALLNSYYHLPGYFRKTSVNSMSYQATVFCLFIRCFVLLGAHKQQERKSNSLLLRSSKDS